MAGRQSRQQKQTIHRVMHASKHGKLESGHGEKIEDRRQAIAIALSEAGAAGKQTPQQRRRRLAKTEAKQRSGDTALARAEDKRRETRPSGKSGSRRKADLYAEARQRHVPGRSKMSKRDLERALKRT